MTVSIPAYCPTCKKLFHSRAIGLGEGANVILENVTTNCSLGHAAKFLDGSYSVKDNILRLAETSPETLRILKRVAEQAVAGTISRTDAANKIVDLAPALAPIFSQNKSDLLPYLALLIYLIVELAKAASGAGGVRIVVENNTPLAREVVELAEDRQLSKRKKRRLDGKAKELRKKRH